MLKFKFILILIIIFIFSSFFVNCTPKIENSEWSENRPIWRKY